MSTLVKPAAQDAFEDEVTGDRTWLAEKLKAGASTRLVGGAPDRS